MWRLIQAAGFYRVTPVVYLRPTSGHKPPQMQKTMLSGSFWTWWWCVIVKIDLIKWSINKISIHPSVLPCAASGDMCWCDRLWIWCLYAYTASTNTMMHPIMPPATGPTGALLIMFRDATSSSVAERQRKKKKKEAKGWAEGHLKYKGFQTAQDVTAS